MEEALLPASHNGFRRANMELRLFAVNISAKNIYFPPLPSSACQAARLVSIRRQPEAMRRPNGLLTKDSTQAGNPFCIYLLNVKFVPAIITLLVHWTLIARFCVPTAPQKNRAFSKNTDFQPWKCICNFKLENPLSGRISGIKARKNVGGLPPANIKNTELDTGMTNASFAAMFTSLADATAECRAVIQVKKKILQRQRHTEKETVKKCEAFALICVTTADAL